MFDERMLRRIFDRGVHHFDGDPGIFAHDVFGGLIAGEARRDGIDIEARAPDAGRAVENCWVPDNEIFANAARYSTTERHGEVPTPLKFGL